MWLPDVMTSTPDARIASAVDGVRPMPPATFSPLAVTKSMPRSSRSSGSRLSTATRPGLPIMSPIMRTRQAPGGRGRLPLAGLPRRVRPIVRPGSGCIPPVCGIRPAVGPRAGLLELERAPVLERDRQLVVGDRIAGRVRETRHVLGPHRALRAGDEGRRAGGDGHPAGR